MVAIEGYAVFRLLLRDFHGVSFRPRTVGTTEVAKMRTTVNLITAFLGTVILMTVAMTK